MNKEEDSLSWFLRLKQFLQGEPQNQEELIVLIRDAQARSLIDIETLTMIEGVIQFAKLKARDIMIPKKQMTCVHQENTLQEIIEIAVDTGHSRLPVTGSNKEEVIGILHTKDLLRFQTEKSLSFDIFDIVRQATFIPESKQLDLLLRDFRNNKNHMALVVDEYGAITGFITIEDVIEQIIGEIEDEFDIEEEIYIKAQDSKHYTVKAHTPIEEFNLQVGANFSNEVYDTIGGIVMASFGYLPKRGEIVTLEGIEFRILSADARRIKLIACHDKRSLERV